MKQIIFTTLLIFAFCFAGFAQENEKSCPNIKIKAPEIVYEEVEEFSVSASFENESNASKSKFDWIIIKEDEAITKSSENIIKIGTRNVGKSYRITILVNNLDRKCQNSTMAKVIVIPNVGHPFIIDKYLNLNQNDERERLNNVALVMKGQFNEDELFAFFEFDKKTSNATKKARLTKVFNFISTSGKIKKNRITFLISESERESTYFQPVPKELSTSYYCDNCIIIRGEDLEKIVNIFENK